MNQRPKGLIVGHGNQPAVLLDDGEGGFTLDFIVSRGDVTILASGRSVEASLSEPFDSPPNRRPGRSLWGTYSLQMHRILWERHRKKPGHRYSKARVKAMTTLTFKIASHEGMIIAGRAAPITAGTAYTPISVADHHLWDFDWLKDLAQPVHGMPGITYVDVRVFSTEEWAAIVTPESASIAPAAEVVTKGQSTSLPVVLTSGRLDFRTADIPLYEEMRRLINSGEARGPLDAARALAHLAGGKGSAESKAKRLLKRWHELVAQSGQN